MPNIIQIHDDYSITLIVNHKPIFSGTLDELADKSNGIPLKHFKEILNNLILMSVEAEGKQK